MIKLLVFVALGCLAWKAFTGRWPWQPKPRPSRALVQARAVLGVRQGAGRKAILDAHRRRLAAVHPDRGGSSEQVHEVNAARDLLLAELALEPPAGGE